KSLCRRIAAIEQVAAPVGDVRRPFEEAPVGGVLRGLECVRRLQRPEREIIPAVARCSREALAAPEIRLRQHLRDLRAAVPRVPGPLLGGLVEIAAHHIDEGHRLSLNPRLEIRTAYCVWEAAWTQLYGVGRAALLVSLDVWPGSER